MKILSPVLIALVAFFSITPFAFAKYGRTCPTEVAEKNEIPELTFARLVNKVLDLHGGDHEIACVGSGPSDGNPYSVEIPHIKKTFLSSMEIQRENLNAYYTIFTSGIKTGMPTLCGYSTHPLSNVSASDYSHTHQTLLSYVTHADRFGNYIGSSTLLANCPESPMLENGTRSSDGEAQTIAEFIYVSAQELFAAVKVVQDEKTGSKDAPYHYEYDQSGIQKTEAMLRHVADLISAYSDSKYEIPVK